MTDEEKSEKRRADCVKRDTQLAKEDALTLANNKECPECMGRLSERPEAEPQDGVYGLLLDCDDCRLSFYVRFSVDFVFNVCYDD